MDGWVGALLGAPVLQSIRHIYSLFPPTKSADEDPSFCLAHESFHPSPPFLVPHTYLNIILFKRQQAASLSYPSLHTKTLVEIAI